MLCHQHPELSKSGTSTWKSISTYLSQIYSAQLCGVGGTEGPMTTGWLDAEIVVVGEEIGAVAVGGGWIVASVSEWLGHS